VHSSWPNLRNKSILITIIARNGKLNMLDHVLLSCLAVVHWVVVSVIHNSEQL
jgi:hypothetical protein